MPVPLVRSYSAPQSVDAAVPVTIQRSASHPDMEKEALGRRQYAQAREGSYTPTSSSPAKDPFNLSAFFPTSFSAVRRREEGWHWLRHNDSEVKEDGYEEDGGDVRNGEGSAIFGQEIREAIKDEDKLGVLSVLKGVSLFDVTTGSHDWGYGDSERLLSPYCSDEVVDEDSLYLAQCARREQWLRSMPSTAGTSAPYGELFLARSG